MIFNNLGNLDTTLENVQTDFTSEEESMVIEAALMEGLTNDELSAFLENTSDVHNAIRMEYVQEKSIIRLDKKAKLSRAYMTSVFSIARKKKDKKFKKLETLWKLEAAIEKHLIKRYGNEAMREAKKSLQKASKSQSNLVKKAVTNVQKSLNGGIGHK